MPVPSPKKSRLSSVWSSGPRRGAGIEIAHPGAPPTVAEPHGEGGSHPGDGHGVLFGPMKQVGGATQTFTNLQGNDLVGAGLDGTVDVKKFVEFIEGEEIPDDTLAEIVDEYLEIVQEQLDQIAEFLKDSENYNFNYEFKNIEDNGATYKSLKIKLTPRENSQELIVTNLELEARLSFEEKMALCLQK